MTPVDASRVGRPTRRRAAAGLVGLTVAAVTAGTLGLDDPVATARPDRRTATTGRATPGAAAKGVTRRLFGLSAPGADGGLGSAEAAAAAVRRHLGIVNFYVGWADQTPLDIAALHRIAAAGARPEITWEPWDYTAGPTQPDYTLARIAGGSFDPYITSFARAAATYGKPILLRFAHEMNGTWYPWSAGANGGSPAAYIAAYRHVHRLFDAAGATNVSWVWCPNAIGTDAAVLRALYPGGRYVDLIGIDGYNGGTDVVSMGGWRTPEQVFGTTLAAIHALAPAVPILINETACAEHGGSKASWISSLFRYLARDRQVVGVVWFDYDKEADWRLDSSPASLSAARAALARW